MGWLLLANALVPIGEPLCWQKRIPPGRCLRLFYGAWLITGLAYCVSGIDKLGSLVGLTVVPIIYCIIHLPELVCDLFLKLPWV